MKENSREEDIEILEELRLRGYAMLLMKYEDRIKTNRKIDQALEHILSDYKRVLKENEELKETYKSEKKMKNEYVKLYQDLLLKENVIPVQKVKDKIEHYQKLQDNYIEKYDEIHEGLQAMINALQELLEGRK